ncbi:hypothetical protein [Novosphingobium acidiphilum]|uniref:hypothetical protein n=1 Tax=Novosphingobium acidiphilum TaxID=505248 RepID=UPI0012EB9D02|nr:hypothetical protein [Novosphingobium acidiphilum]
MARADWTLRDAIIWAHDRNDERVYHPTFELPHMIALIRYDEESTWILAARDILAALCNGRLRAFRQSADGGESAIGAGFWNDKSVGQVNQLDQGIVIRAASVTELFPTSMVLGEAAAGRPLKIRYRSIWPASLVTAEILNANSAMARCISAGASC